MSRPMKQSGVDWLGDIPADWTLAQLKRFALVNSGREILTEINQTADAIPVYGSGGIFKYTTNYLYDGETVMFGRKGTLGKPIYANEKFWTVDTMYYLTFSDKLFAKFNYYQLVAFDWEPHITQTALPSIVASEIVSCKFAFPPLDEQQRIANFLDDKCARIDSVIEKTRASIDEYKKLKQAVITRAVTRGIRPARPTKFSGVDWLGEVPDDWEIVKLKHISRFMQTKYNASDGNLNYIGLENIVGWSGAFIETDSVYDREQSLICEAGDILFGKLRPYLAKVYLNKSKQCCSGEFAVIRMNDFTYRKFFYYQLMSHGFIFTVDSSTYGTKMPRANAEFIKNICVIVPPLDEQKEIAAYLDEKTAAIDSLIAKKNQLASELERLKKSLIFEYVTGKKELAQ
ncbi:MAG: restriction endonuclease subunit S [Selenomonadaceae bacterium]|nr:restriction endonuclease subunit S [Selenomonadaceae bacterium]